MTDTPSEPDISNYERKFRRALAEIENSGLRKHINVDLDLRYLRAIGFEPRPFHYWESVSSFVYLFVFLVVLIGAVDAAVMFLLSGKLCTPDIVGPAVLAAIPLTALSILVKWYQ